MVDWNHLNAWNTTKIATMHYWWPSHKRQRMGIRGVRSHVFLSPAPVLIPEAKILILVQILFATRLWNPNPEKMLLAYVTNVQLFTFFYEKQSFSFN